MADKIVLRFVGKSFATGQKLEPPSFVVDGQDTIQLPSPATQLREFSLEDDAKTLRVARLFPTHFKVFKVKGK